MQQNWLTTSDRPEERRRVSVEECQEALSARFDFPRADDETEDRAEQLTSSQVHVFGEKRHGIVAERYRVAGHIGSDHGEGKDEADEEFRGSVVPHEDDCDGVPLDFPVDHLRRGGHYDTEEVDECHAHRKRDGLSNGGCPRITSVARQVGDVDGEC